MKIQTKYRIVNRKTSQFFKRRLAGVTIWSSVERDTPRFDSVEQANRFISDLNLSNCLARTTLFAAHE